MRLVNGVKCRLLPASAILAQNQEHAFFSNGPNIREHAENELASCKTSQPITENESPGATAIATGAEDVVESVCMSRQHNAVPSSVTMPGSNAAAAEGFDPCGPFDLMGVTA